MQPPNHAFLHCAMECRLQSRPPASREVLMNRLLIAFLASTLMTGCSGSTAGEKDSRGGENGDDTVVMGTGDPSAITIAIQSPERGTLTTASDVLVAGRASSTGTSISAVTVNGTAADLASDGSFEATIPLVEGITLIETEATDAAGNSAIDARAVMAGTLVDRSTPVAAGVVAALSAQAMAGLSSMVSDLA